MDFIYLLLMLAFGAALFAFCVACRGLEQRRER